MQWRDSRQEKQVLAETIHPRCNDLRALTFAGPMWWQRLLDCLGRELLAIPVAARQRRLVAERFSRPLDQRVTASPSRGRALLAALASARQRDHP